MHFASAWMFKNTALVQSSSSGKYKQLVAHCSQLARRLDALFAIAARRGGKFDFNINFISPLGESRWTIFFIIPGECSWFIAKKRRDGIDPWYCDGQLSCIYFSYRTFITFVVNIYIYIASRQQMP